MRLKFLLTTILFVTVFTSKAQELGGQAGIAFITNAKFNPTLGLHWNDKIKDHSIQYGFNLHAPMKFESDRERVDYINPVLGTSEPLSTYKDKVNMLDLYCLYRYFIWGKSKESGGLIALGGVTLGFQYSKLEPGYYDKNIYKLNSHFTKDQRFFVQPCINLGVGYDLELKDRGMLGFQLPIYFNTKKVTDTALDDASQDHALTVVSFRVTYSFKNFGKVDHTKDELPTR